MVIVVMNEKPVMNTITRPRNIINYSRWLGKGEEVREGEREGEWGRGRRM